MDVQKDTRRKILFVSLNFFPELTGIGKYSGEFVTALSRRNFRVEVLTTYPYYPYGYKFDSSINDDELGDKSIQVHRLRTPYGKGSTISNVQRILKACAFEVKVSLRLIQWKLTRKVDFDQVILISPPFFVGFVAKMFLPSTKFHVHIQDLEIDAATELGMLPKFITKIAFSIEKLYLRKVESLSTINDNMRSILCKRLNREVGLLYNWIDEQKIHPTSKTSILNEISKRNDKSFFIVYSGNLGNKQNLDIIPAVAKRLELEFASVHFIILGEGTYKIEFTQLVGSYELSNVTIGSICPEKKLNELLNSADIHLVLQKIEGSENYFPSKMMNILGVGGVSIFTTKKSDGIVAEIFDNECAMISDGTADDLYAKIRNIMYDKDLAARISANALNISRRFHVDKSIDAFIKCYM
jgi:colanic acid biosynthesis glycosyl transferase WcaI